MAKKPRPRSSTHEAILQERERSDQAVLRQIETWCRPEDESEPRETLAYLKRALDEGRPADRKLFSWNADDPSDPSGHRSPGDVIVDPDGKGMVTKSLVG